MIDRQFGDEYGFAAATKTGLRLYGMSSRRTGRTSRMIERVRKGDVIICADSREKERVQRLLREAKKAEIDVVVVNPQRTPLRDVGTRPNGRVFFDHGWIERYFEIEIDRAANQLGEWHVAISKTWPEPPESLKDAPYLDPRRRFEPFA
ncbi:hypothetical protein [Terrarubrum flagellatum]|uniref:hypothetical protein n=1 Tax=Terrirubrum flagellatum TaxID=2895980 RepID=UPI003144F066